MKFCIKANGATGITQVFNVKTGEKIGNLRSILFNHDADGIALLSLEVVTPDCEIVVEEYVPKTTQK